MRLILYYMTRAVKNQIKKLFRTWVAIFLVVCIGIGFLFGLGAAGLASLFEEDIPEEEYEEVLPEEEAAEEWTLTEEQTNGIVELAVGAIVLFVLAFSVALADKNGGSIFLMADVNLLFPAPMKPQSVLLFRLIMQAGTSIIATIYLLFQIPNLVLNLGLGAGTVFAMLGAWLLLMIYAKLISVLLYTVSSTKPSVKRYLRPCLWTALLLIGAGYYLWAQHSANYFNGALEYFNGPFTRYIPVWGWLKGLVLYAMEGNVAGALLSALALLLLAVALVLIIWRIKADFYEDAMARSEETAEKQAQMQSAKPQLQKRKKDRNDTLRRDGLNRGAGATVYFHKAMYNRFRFAHLRIFTKTSETYLVTALGVCLLMLLVIKADFFPAVAIVLGGFAFFRSLGNPISQDISQETFFLVPDTAHRKVFFSFAAGVVNSALDLLPAFLVAALLLRPAPLTVLVWFLVVVSLGAYSDGIGMFIDLSLSTGLSQTIKSVIQIMFIYFGLAPAAVLIILGFALDQLILFALLTVLVNLGIAGISLLVSPLFVERGRR
ncbi:MAG: hypothetical protein IJX39_03350 [Clostridia bacterium]|nr:hypothetical protein [Clostridia bacterium]